MAPTAVVLHGPKAAGKSQVAEVLRARHGVAHVDADALVLDLSARGVQPDARLGWLPQVEDAVERALAAHAAVSVEATGAWDSDWQLADDLRRRGQTVLTVWVSAPLDVTLRRIAARTTRKAPVTEADVRAIWHAANDQARERIFDLRLDTVEIPETEIPRALEPLTTRLRAT